MSALRSALTVEVLASAGEEVYGDLVVSAGPDSGSAAVGLLAAASSGQLVAGPVASPALADAALAALWLWIDRLDEAHRIVQDTPRDRRAAADYAFWHAIVHRREGDFWNSKYWLNRCSDHPALPAIGNAATHLINSRRHADPRLMTLTLGAWDPAAFVDLVDAANDRPEDSIRPALVELQRSEWRVLFDHTLRSAAGAA